MKSHLFGFKFSLLILTTAAITISPVAERANAAPTTYSAKLLGGINVVFRSEPKVRSSEKDLLHKKTEVRLLYRAKFVEIDSVLPSNSSKARNLEYLESLCNFYKKFPVVKDCEIRREGIPNDVSSCPPPKSDGPLPKGLTKLAESVSSLAKCEPVDLHGQTPLLQGTLTPLWAQELVGADLVRNEFAPWKKSAKAVPFFSFELIDMSRMEPEKLTPNLRNFIGKQGTFKPDPRNGLHGVAVAQLVADPKFGVAANAVLAAAAVTSVPRNDRGSNWDHFDDVNELKVFDDAMAANAKLLCSSQVVSPDFTPAKLEMIKTFNASGGITVESSGNSFRIVGPDTNGDPSWSITVGSLSPSGLISDFSSSGPQVTIAAPSDNFIQAGHGESSISFGGTSGAQPLACGAVANVISLLPGVTLPELQEIITRTAVPTTNAFENPRHNGAGMLNAYQMFKVAGRLSKSWPQSRARIFNDASLFDFKNEAADLYRESQRKAGEDPCEMRKNILLLRRAFLLDPHNLSYVEKLAKSYNSLGFTQNASFLSTIGKRPDLATIETIFKQPNIFIQLSAERALEQYGPEAYPTLRNLVATSPTGRNQETGEYFPAYFASRFLEWIDRPCEPTLFSMYKMKQCVPHQKICEWTGVPESWNLPEVHSLGAIDCEEAEKLTNDLDRESMQRKHAK